MSANDVDIAIIGAGATGAYLALAANHRGLRAHVFERAAAPAGHSRAIGIHPPGLTALNRVGVVDTLVARGVRVRVGHATSGDHERGVRHLGRLDFERTLPGPWRFVLTVPQHVTEAVLVEHLERHAPGALHWNSEVRAWNADESGANLTLADGSHVRAGLLVAATGARAADAARIADRIDGTRYGDTYLMGDVPITVETVLHDPRQHAAADQARIHLAPRGVVEAFPLPHAQRRWVAKTHELVRPADPRQLANLVEARCGVRLDPDAMVNTSSFGVQWRLALPMAKGRTWLAGDAAHVVAPIGGQGMTLAWLGANRLLDAWTDHLEGRRSVEAAAASYDAAQRREARRARQRAAWNLRMGRASDAPWARDLLTRTLLTDPLAARMARLFTMQAA